MEKAMFYMGVVMVGVYLLVGILLLTGSVRLSMPSSYAQLLGGIVTCYSIYRAVNIYHRYFRK